MQRLILLIFVVMIGGVALAGSARTASAAIEVRSQTVKNLFPDGLQFTLFTASDANISEVRLRFRILPDGVNASLKPNCTNGTVVNCMATVGSTQASYMVPGAEIHYYWEITDAAGGRLVTEEKSTTYEDVRFQWDSISDGNLSVHFYFGDVASQQTVLNTAKATIERFSKLEKTTVDFPVKIWVYKTAAEMAPAVASRRGSGPDTSISTLGEVAASDTALVSRDTDFLNIVRHEITHIVTGAASRTHGYIVDMPVWINEGMSVFAQNALLPSEDQAFALAIQRNRVLPISSLNASARGSAGNVSIFYSESGSIIAFMVNSFGDEKFGQFIAALASMTTDKALQSVYGFDQLGLENAWRKTFNLPEAGSTGADSTTTPQSVPTLVPFGSSGGSASKTPTSGGNGANASNAKEGGDSTGSFLIVAGAVIAVVVLAGSGFYLQKRRSGS